MPQCSNVCHALPFGGSSAFHHSNAAIPCSKRCTRVNSFSLADFLSWAGLSGLVCACPLVFLLRFITDRSPSTSTSGSPAPRGVLFLAPLSGSSKHFDTSCLVESPCFRFSRDSGRSSLLLSDIARPPKLWRRAGGWRGVAPIAVAVAPVTPGRARPS